MILCRVTGDVVSTVKNEKLAGKKILIVQPVDLDSKTPTEDSFLAVDLVGAGVTDLVLVVREGGGVRIVLQDDKIPLSNIITCIVDDFEVVADEATLIGSSCVELNRAGEEV